MELEIQNPKLRNIYQTGWQDGLLYTLDKIADYLSGQPESVAKKELEDYLYKLERGE